MFKKGSYNVKKAEDKSKTSSSVKPKTTNSSNTQTSTMTLKKKASEMTLKQKAAITNTNNKESPEYRRNSHPKTVTTNKRWVENKTFNPK